MWLNMIIAPDYYMHLWNNKCFVVGIVKYLTQKINEEKKQQFLEYGVRVKCDHHRIMNAAQS